MIGCWRTASLGEPTRFVAALVFVWWFPSAARAADSVMCSTNLQLQGEQQPVEDLRGKLATGTLGELSADVCARAVVELRSLGTGYEVRLVLGDERVARTVDTIADAAVWVESWLLPMAVDKEPPQPVTIDTKSPVPAPAAVAENDPPRRSDPKLVLVHPDAALGIVSAGAVSDDGAVWAAGELSADILISKHLWLGAALGGAVDTELSGPLEGRHDLRRGFVRATARTGTRIPFSEPTELRLGVGMGVGSAWVTQVSSDDADKGRGGLLVEALGRIATPLSDDMSLTTGLVLRGHVVRFATGSLDAEEASLPEPLPVWHAELQVGLGFSVGGGP